MFSAKYFVLGANGFLGKAFMKASQNEIFFGSQHRSPYSPLFFNLFTPSLENLPLNSCHFTHAIVATSVGTLHTCQTSPKETWSGNVNGTLKVAALLAEKKICPVIFSTSYIFDGIFGEYTEKSLHSPINEYGKQLSAIEQRISNATKGNYLLLRLNKVFSTYRHPSSFVDKICEKLLKKDLVLALDDQVIAPISTSSLVQITQHLMNKNVRGTYNLSGTDSVTRYEIALKLAMYLGIGSEYIIPIQLNSLNDSILRPKITTLRLQKIISEDIPYPAPLNVSLKEIARKWKISTSYLETTGPSI